MAKPYSVWIIGPACAGKTTLAQLFVDKLKNVGRPCIILDSPQVRDLFDSQLGYDTVSRRKQTARMKRLAKLISMQDVLSVVALIHPFEDDRVNCRKDVPGYFEVFLKCDMEELIRRDTKKLYLPALRGKKRNVIGIDIPFDEPRNPDLIIESDRLNPGEMLDVLWRRYEEEIQSG